MENSQRPSLHEVNNWWVCKALSPPATSLSRHSLLHLNWDWRELTRVVEVGIWDLEQPGLIEMRSQLVAQLMPYSLAHSAYFNFSQKKYSIYHQCHPHRHDQLPPPPPVQQFAQTGKAVARKQRWSFPQPCSLFSSHSPLSLPIFSMMTGQPKDQERGN